MTNVDISHRLIEKGIRVELSGRASAKYKGRKDPSVFKVSVIKTL